MIGESNHEVQIKVATDKTEDSVTSNNKFNSALVDVTQLDVLTLDKIIVDKVLREEDSTMTTVETWVQDAILATVENIVDSMLELSMTQVNASSGRI